MWTHPSSGAILLAVLAWMGATGCTEAPDDAALTVFVASSLTEVAADLTDEWASTSGVVVELVAGGSNHLAAQVRDGAPADAFLTADADLFDDLQRRLIVNQAIDHVPTAIHDLAINHLVVARPTTGPERRPADLRDPSLVLVACAAGVPCGDAAAARFGDLPVDSFEPSARAVVARLALDEADLGIVYATDVSAHAGLAPAWPQKPTCPCITYAAASLSLSGNPFVAFLASDRARQILTEHGFVTEPTR
ncbi:MAG: substrate-binding domain-containing protein [Acidimicrobiales bacterium]|nr:substrate-binding domain-containing protein [Acidimicrobiales bacterium]